MQIKNDISTYKPNNATKIREVAISFFLNLNGSAIKVVSPSPPHPPSPRAWLQLEHLFFVKKKKKKKKNIFF